MPDGTLKDILQNVFWAASTKFEATSPNINAWLHRNPGAFLSIWDSLLSNEVVQDDEYLRGILF